MRKTTYFLLLIVFFITGLSVQFFAQNAERVKTRVLIDRFNPLMESPENTVFEENLPSLIRLSFINQKSYTFLEDGEKTIANLTSGKKKVQQTGQFAYQANRNQISEIADVVLYGDYSITAEEIYIVPKLYDTKHDKFFTLQSIRISDFAQGLNPGKFEALITAYRDKLRSITKSNSNLKKVGLRLASNAGSAVSSFEESLFKSFVVMATKSLDTTNLFEVVPVDKMKSFYLTETQNSEIAKEAEADIVYNIFFENVSEDVIQVNFELFFNESNKSFRFNTFTFDLYGDRIIENDIVFDFYGLFKEILIGDTFDLNLLSFEGTTPFSYEDQGDVFYEEQKYFLSNLMYYKALTNQSEEFLPFDYYMIAMNFEASGQSERAIDYFYKSLAIDPDYKFSWSGLAYASYSLGDYGSAADAWLNVHIIDPDYETANIQYNLGLSYYGLENYSKALDYFASSIVEGYSYEQDAYFYIAICYEATLNYEGAINFYKKALVQVPDDYYNLVYLAYFNYHAGEIALYDGNYEQAAEYLDAADSIYVNELDYDDYLNSLIYEYTNLRRLAYLYINDYEGAWEITQQGISDGQFDPFSIYYDNATELNYVISVDDEKKYNEIIRYYLVHADINPYDSIIDQVYNSTGYYYSLLGDIKTSALYFEKALEYNPENLSAQLNIMELYLVLEKYNDVSITAEKILSSVNMTNQMNADNGIHSVYYFLLLNAKVATNKNYDNDKTNFEKYLKESDFNLGWDFSLYESWLNKLSNEKKKKILNEFYDQLKERISQLQLSE